LEIWLQPNRIWDSGTLLAFYSPKTRSGFSLRQDQTDLSLKVVTEGEHRHPSTESLRIKDVFRRLPPSYITSAPSFITITSDGSGVSIYVDGALASSAPAFTLFTNDFKGRFVLGDSPGQPDSWKGRLFGLAIYGWRLEKAEVLHNYAIWKQNGRPELPQDERNLALYLFDERKGNVVLDKAHSGVNLYIPEKYEVMEKFVLEPFWAEFTMSRSYWRAALKNIVGFIPFGMSFCAYFSIVRPARRATLLTVVLGLSVSLTIEVLQAFLPNRDSGTSDLITNTLGTWLGAVSFRLLMPALAQMFPKANLFASHR
jgi:glycopeptide antibiotics resistance protein